MDALFTHLRQPLSTPFAKELVVVQGQGMATWLNMELSRRAGIWANTEYLYPKHFLERMFAAVLGGEDERVLHREQYSPDALLWTVAARLPRHLDDAAFEALRGYVGSPIDENRLFLLAGKIAETFDEYLTYRPELLRLWSKEEAHFAEPQLDLFQQSHATDPAIWQRRLWRDIESVLGPHHASALEKRCHAALSRRKHIAGLPERISLFGLSTLPPMYIRLLAALSKHIPVHLYLHSPTEEYFGDVPLERGPRQVHQEGNRLVRSLATLAAEFSHVITESCEALHVAEIEHAHYEAPAPSSLLRCVQTDLLHFTESQRDLDADGSIVIHSCHSPIREVEVLHDQVLQLIHVEGFRPEDILVLLPDVESYAPLLDAVFRRDDDRFLPYRIADRQADAESAVVKAFLRVLDLVSERVTSAQVMDVVSLPPVRKRFGLESLDLPTITDWLVRAHVTWGMDERHRERETGRGEGNTTWQAGLDRLLLGYAVDTDGQELVSGIYPYEHIEGKDALLLGNFRRFTTLLFTHLEKLTQPQLPEDWQLSLAKLIDDLLLVTKEESWQKQWLLDAVQSLATLSRQAGYTLPVGVQVVRRILYQRLEQQGAARGFLAGGITMSALIPMRSVPFQVIFVLGLNDGAFPRDAHRTDFNLLEHGEDKRRYGDANRRQDDRYLFLEALLSARSRFVASYVGQSVRDNSLRSPSVVLVELIETIRSCATEPSKIDNIVIRHPLQPFSQRYFDATNPRLSSFAREFIPKNDASIDPETAFVNGELPPRRDAASTIAIAELLSFFRSPTRHFLERRLKVRFQEQLVTLQEQDATGLAPLEAYQGGAPLLTQARRGIPVERCLELARAQGALPAGQIGRYEFHQLEYTALSLADIASTLGAQGVPNTVAVSTAVGARRIEGSVPDVYADRRIHLQFARVTGRAILRAWLEHLVLGLVLPAFRESASTWLVGREAQGERAIIFRYLPVTDPEPLLADLVEIYEWGCRLALPLFPDLAYTFTKGGEPRLTNALLRDWDELQNRDAAVARVFARPSRLRIDEPMLTAAPGNYPLFGEMSHRVFGPLMRHLDERGSSLDHEAV